MCQNKLLSYSQGDLEFNVPHFSKNCHVYKYAIGYHVNVIAKHLLLKPYEFA